MSFESENVLRTTFKCAESPGDNSTIHKTRASEDCSVLPLRADEDLIEPKFYDMPSLGGSSFHLRTDINVKLDTSNDTNLIRNFECQLNKMFTSNDNVFQHSSDTSTKGASDEKNDVSQSLVFQKTKATVDAQLKYGCFVKLNRIKVPKRYSEAIDTYQRLTKKFKWSQKIKTSKKARNQRKNKRTTSTKGEINNDSKSIRENNVRSSNYKTHDDSLNRFNDQCRIVLRFERSKDCSFYKCFRVLDIGDDKREVNREFYPMNEQPVQQHSKEMTTLQSIASTSYEAQVKSDIRNSAARNATQSMRSKFDKQNILSKSKAQRSDTDQRETKEMKHTMLPKSKADRVDRPKDQSYANPDLNSTNMNQSVQLNFCCGRDARIIPKESKADKSLDLCNSLLNCKKMDEFKKTDVVTAVSHHNAMIENYAINQPLETYNTDQPLDLTISKNVNPTEHQETERYVEQNIAKKESFSIDYKIEDSQPSNNIKRNLKELFGSSGESLSSDGENVTSSANCLQQDFQPLLCIDKTSDAGVASKDSDDNSSVCSELSIFAPSLSDLSDSPPRIAKGNNNIFDMKKYRIPKITRKPYKSEKQREDERPNTKVKSKYNFSDSRVPAPKSETQNKLPLKKIIGPSQKQATNLNVPKTMESIPNVKDKVKEKNTEIPITQSVALENPIGLGSVGANAMSNILKDASQDIEKTNSLPPGDFINTTNPINCNDTLFESIFRTCVNNSKRPLTIVNRRQSINIRENVLIKVSYGNSTSRNVRCIPNDNQKEEKNCDGTFDLSVPNGSQNSLDLITNISTVEQQSTQKLILPLPIQKQIPQIPTVQPLLMKNQTPLIQLIPQLHELRSSSTSSIPKELKSSEDLISQKKRQSYRNQRIKMFDGPCISFLANRQCQSPCRYKHILPPVDVIKQRLKCVSNEMIQFMYTDFIAKFRLTFEMYFPLICQFYGERTFRPSLLRLIKDCEKFEKTEYFKCIFASLILCGLNKRDALLEIFANCQISSASDEIILQIIETDPQCFIDILLSAPRLKLSATLMTKLLKQVAEDPQPCVLRNCTELLERIGEMMLNIERNVLNTFCAKVFEVEDDALSKKILHIINNSLVSNKCLK